MTDRTAPEATEICKAVKTTTQAGYRVTKQKSPIPTLEKKDATSAKT